jgi:hypothetical protein
MLGSMATPPAPRSRRPPPSRGSATGGRRAGRAATRAAVQVGPGADDLIVVSRGLADLAAFLRPRHEPRGRGRVIVDRRASATATTRPPDERRHSPAAAEALMRVLGFMVVPSADADAAPSRSGGRATNGARGGTDARPRRPRARPSRPRRTRGR